jgi:serine protease AprX
VKVLDAGGNGSLDAIVAAIDWIVANKDVYGIEAINLSLGASGCSNGTDVTSQAVSRAVAAGIGMSRGPST